MESTSQRYSPQRWFVGSTLILVGLILFLMNIGIIARFSVWRFVPLLLIASGIARMLEPYRRSEGFWLLALGTWLQASFLRLGGLTFGDTWPAALIALGVYLIWQTIERDARRRHKEQHDRSSSTHPSQNT